LGNSFNSGKESQAFFSGGTPSLLPEFREIDKAVENVMDFFPFRVIVEQTHSEGG
jgi:hypothetical protein